MRKQFLFVSLLAMTGCGQISQQSSDTSAIVSKQQATQAFGVVQAIDYLPFTYIVDGCYARSLYMSLELASHGIPSSAHYVFGSLRPTSSVSWTYHVAPLLQLENSSQEPWILDPAFEKEPLLRSQWIDKNFAQSSATLKAKASGTKTQIRAGSAYFSESDEYAPYDTDETNLFGTVKDSNGNITKLTLPSVDPSVLIPNFENMPRFKKSDIQDACSTMYSYIGNETTTTSAQKTTKRTKLLAATTRLTRAMLEAGKLNNDASAAATATSCSSAVSAAL